MQLDKAYSHKNIEAKWYSRWMEARAFEPAKGTGRYFSMVMPPPNVTGSLHMGHALNNTLQDILCRYKRMDGFRVLWIPGTDHAGIATQNVVERRIAAEGLTRSQLGREKFIERVWVWKEEAGNAILHQLRALGVSCDWAHERFTMDEGLSRAVREAFVRLWEGNLLYRAERLINWCPRCKTALSDIEVIHEESDGNLWHIRYPLADDPSQALVVATTRPETMLGDTGVAVHPDDERYQKLIGQKIRLPITGRVVPVIADPFVDREFGTGALKITPGHDFSDFEIGERFGLEKISIFDADARIDAASFIQRGETGDWIERYRGKDRFEARRLVVADLKEQGFLEKVDTHKLSVGHCYRCQTIIDEGACCRLALTDEDRAGRDLVVSWMRELGLEVRVDRIGNIFGVRRGSEDLAPVMSGSHIDTVRTGGRFDGNLGVLGALEVVETLNDAGARTRRPLVVAVFTNEEGARFAPDMLGSLAYVGGLPLQQALDTVGIDGKRLGDELERIGYAGDAGLGLYRPHAFVELHIEQGPVLDLEGVRIGAVESLQGISWQEVSITGQSNHAGTTPMRLRHDAGYCAAAIGTKLREIARELGGDQVCTMGMVKLHPNLINVIAARATVTVDIRNTDEARLQEAERRFADFLEALARAEGVKIETRRLARFEPVRFDDGIAHVVERHAAALGLSCRRMTSGAGHDAQMLARICPTAMIFVPSIGGISHNPAEDTRPEDLAAGADVLLRTLVELAS